MRKVWQIMLGIFAIIGGIQGTITLYDYLSSIPQINLSGEWLVLDSMKSGPYKNGEVVFKLFIQQEGNHFKGEGEKVLFNGDAVGAIEKSPLKIISGTINASSITAVFIEEGRIRETRGEFTWRIINNDLLKGKFSTTAANGTSTAKRIK